jgi:predicted RNA-binding Zn ribbon-like protein
VAAGLVSDIPEVTEAELLSARALRETIHRLAWNRIRAETPAEEDLGLLNHWAALPPPSPQLGRGGLTWIGRGVSANLAGIAREAVELLGGPGASRVRNCARDGCSILFFDTSRSGRRRWCSMTACGNKAKVDAFRKRRRMEN